MNTFHFLIDTGPLARDCFTMTGVHADMNLAIADICRGVAGPWIENLLADAGTPASAHGSFGNPRAFIIEVTTDRILAGIRDGSEPSLMKPMMESFMKLQALEAQSAEDAIRFLRDLKRMVGDMALSDRNPLRREAARAMEQSIDELVPVAAGMYLEYRDLVARLKEREKMRARFRENLTESYRYVAPPVEDRQ